jgi:hypothetical protein
MPKLCKRPSCVNSNKVKADKLFIHIFKFKHDMYHMNHKNSHNIKQSRDMTIVPCQLTIGKHFSQHIVHDFCIPYVQYFDLINSIHACIFYLCTTCDQWWVVSSCTI